MLPQFHKAQRRKSKLRLALAGPSGSGKTYSALLIAFGMGGRVAMLDTERGSGEMYDHLGDYDVCTIEAPFTPEKYINAIKAAEEAQYDVIINDSLSHAWAGQGGLLDVHGHIADKTGNSWAAWRQITPKHNELVDTMLQSRCHIIATMRSKMDYVQVSENGKTVVKKVGMNPIQRDGMEYEFTLFLDLDHNHVATASKDRTSLFDCQFFKPSKETGRILLNWLETCPEPSRGNETVLLPPGESSQAKGPEQTLEQSQRACPEQVEGTGKGPSPTPEPCPERSEGPCEKQTDLPVHHTQTGLPVQLITRLCRLGLNEYVEHYKQYVYDKYSKDGRKVESLKELSAEEFAEQERILETCRTKYSRLNEFRALLQAKTPSQSPKPKAQSEKSGVPDNGKNNGDPRLKMSKRELGDLVMQKLQTHPELRDMLPNNPSDITKKVLLAILDEAERASSEKVPSPNPSGEDGTREKEAPESPLQPALLDSEHPTGPEEEFSLF